MWFSLIFTDIVVAGEGKFMVGLNVRWRVVEKEEEITLLPAILSSCQSHDTAFR